MRPLEPRDGQRVFAALTLAAFALLAVAFVARHSSSRGLSVHAARVALQPGAIPLVGTVRTVSRGPLSGVSVRVRRLPREGKAEFGAALTAVTDAQGKYELQLPPGEYALEVSRPSYAKELRSPVRVQPGGARRDIVLLPAAVIAGRALERATGKGVSGVLVEVHAAGSFGAYAGEGPRAVTDSTGMFRLEGVHPGDVELTARSTTLAVREPLRLSLAPGAEAQAELWPEPARRLRGKVVSRSNPSRALSGVWIDARDALSGESVPCAAATTADGLFEIVGLHAGTYALDTYGDGRAVVHGEQTIALGDQDVSDLILLADADAPVVQRAEPSASPVENGKTGGFSGRVLDARGEPLAEARVSISSATPSFEPLAALAHRRGAGPRLYDALSSHGTFRYVDVAADGRFEAQGLPLGDYELRVWDRFGARAFSWSSTQRAAERDLERNSLSSEQRAELPLRATLKATDGPTAVELSVGACTEKIVGRVSDRAGAALVGAWVLAWRFDGGTKPLDAEVAQTARSQADGQFELNGLCPGAYQIEAGSSDGTRRGRKLSVRPGANVAVKVYELATLSAIVTHGGQPVTDFTVSLGGPQNRLQRFHSADGHFRISGLETSEYSLAIECEQGYLATSVAIIPERKRDLRFELVPYSSLSGTLVDNRLSPLSGVRVELIVASDGGASGFESMAASKRRVRSATTDGSGHFALDRLFARSGQLSLIAEGRHLFLARTRFLSPLGTMMGANSIIEVATRPGEHFELGTLEVKNSLLAR